MPEIDLDRLRAEDEMEDLYNQPMRVAAPLPTALTTKAGTWTELPDGGRVWQLNILARDAQAISLLYDEFYLPPGATLHLYNPQTGETHGAFTARNNKPSRRFATAFVLGEETVLECYEPADQRGQTSLLISQVGHAYRLFEVEDGLARPRSGACQVNVNCSPEGDNWQDEKRGVARLLINGSSFCTGSLLNNTAQDGTPYFLTADHCIGSLDAVSNPDASQWVFHWNYERTACSETSTPAPTNQTTAGATLRANDSGSDFALFELQEDPNGVYPIYFNGFSAEPVAPAGGAGIHHPSGDYKKIATHSMVPPVFTFDGRPAGAYWNISWDATTNGHSVTEGGSSGSPLFDADGRVIGQLYGGSSINCFDPANDPGWYGRIAYSWTNGGNPAAARRLNAWLDPVSGGGTLSVAGGNPPRALPQLLLTNQSPVLTFREAGTSGQLACRGYIDIPLEVSVTRPPGSVFTVAPALTTTGNGLSTDDYTITPANLTFGPGTTTGTFTLRVYDDQAVEGTENLTYSLVSSDPTVTVRGLASQQLLIEDNDQALTAPVAQTVGTGNFTAGLPSNWAIQDGGASTATWAVTTDRNGNTLNSGDFIIMDSDAAGSGVACDEVLLTATYDLSNAVSAELTFDHYFLVYAGGGTAETAEVDVFFNGQWVNLLQMTEAGGTRGSWSAPEQITLDLTPYRSAQTQVRFRYVANYDWWWALDNIRITSTVTAGPASTTIAGFDVYLGPLQEVVLREPGTGVPIAAVRNLTGTDHGCSTISVERDALTQTAYPFSTNNPTGLAFGRTLRVQAGAAGAAAQYELAWLFSQNELDQMSASTGLPTAALGIAKVSGAAFGTVTPANFGSYTIDWQPATFTANGTNQTATATFTSGFSAFGLTADPAQALPVTWAGFSGEALPGHNRLYWRTANEYQNAGFHVERSADGRLFEPLGFVAPGPTPTTEQTYSFDDKAAPTGRAYYRLRQEDLDGTYDYSSIITLHQPDDTDRLIAVLTAPQELHLSSEEALQTLDLYRTDGRRVARWRTLAAGQHQLVIDGRLPAGIYLLHARSESGKRYTMRVLR